MCGVVAPDANLQLVIRAYVTNAVHSIHASEISGAALLPTKENVTAEAP